MKYGSEKLSFKLKLLAHFGTNTYNHVDSKCFENIIIVNSGCHSANQPLRTYQQSLLAHCRVL